ncbi:uncharacterized protein LOC144148675 [Haemaphysalis longicornis]
MEQLRACGSDYVPYGNRVVLQHQGEKFRTACELHLRQIKCGLDFIEQCLEGLSKVAAKLAATSMEETFEAVCTEGTDQNKLFLEGIPCMNAAGSQLHYCMRTLAATLQRATSKAPRKEIIHYACCAYHTTVQCTEDALASCDTDAAEMFMTGSLDNIIGESLSLVCGQYSRGSTACLHLPELPELDPSEERAPNIIELSIEVASSLGKK